MEVQRTVMGLRVTRMLRVSEQIEAVTKATATPLRDTAFVIGPGIHWTRSLQISNKTPSYSMPQTTLSSRGEVVFPSEFLDEDGLKPGETFEVERTKAGEYIFRRKRRGSPGLLEALLQFQKIAPGEKLQLMDWSQDTTDNFRNPFE